MERDTPSDLTIYETVMRERRMRRFQEWINEHLSREMQSGDRVIVGLKDDQ